MSYHDLLAGLNKNVAERNQQLGLSNPNLWPTGGLPQFSSMPDAAAAFAKYQNIAPGTVTPQPYEIIQDVLNNPVYSPEQKELILEGYRQNVGLDATTFDVIRNAAMGTPYTTAELEDIFKDTTDDKPFVPETPKTPKETFQEKTDEEKIVDINNVLDENPGATLDDILRVMVNWGISEDLFVRATGKTPVQYTTPAGPDGGTGGPDGGTGGPDGGADEGDGGDGSCQPGYEKWNGTCVPVCNAAAGYVRDEATGQCVLKEKPKSPEPPQPEPCPEGYKWDEATQSCEKIDIGDTGGNGGDGGTSCPTGYVYDEASQSCVPIKKEVTGEGGDLNGPVETPQIISQLPQLPETETATGGLLFGAVSPTRTTDEVLAPDLFKLDVNIPLISRLTQYSPMAAPQYMLSGISQRYKV